MNSGNVESYKSYRGYIIAPGITMPSYGIYEYEVFKNLGQYEEHNPVHAAESELEAEQWVDGVFAAVVTIAVGANLIETKSETPEVVVTLYHETSLRPEIIRREGLRPPRPDYTLGFLSRQLGIPLSSVDPSWLKSAAEDRMFYDYLYGPEPGTSKRTERNLFFWMYKPPVHREAGLVSSELERFALDMVRSSSVHMTAEEIRSKLFADVPSIVTVRIPGSWIWGAKPRFVEWLVSAQAAGEKVDIEIEVGVPIPPKYILSIEEEQGEHRKRLKRSNPGNKMLYFESGDTCPVCGDQALLEQWLEYPISGQYLVCPCPGCPFSVYAGDDGRFGVSEKLVRSWCIG